MIHVLLKAIEVVEAFSIETPRMSLAQLAEATGYPKTTLRTILATLESRGYVARVGSDYALGTAVIHVSQSALVNVEIRDRAAPGLRRLAELVGESVYLTVPDGDRLLYIYAIESPHRLEARSAIGEHAFYHSTAVGKAALAFMPDERRSAILGATGLPRRTAATMSDRADLAHDLERTRARGFSIDRCENEPDTYCVGAPIFGARGAMIAACSISGNTPEVIEDRIDELSSLLVQTAENISKRLGYVPARTRIAPPARRPVR